MTSVIILVIVVGAVALAYWALSTMPTMTSSKQRKTTTEPQKASRKKLSSSTKNEVEELIYELVKPPRKTRSDKGKKRGTYKKGKK